MGFSMFYLGQHSTQKWVGFERKSTVCKLRDLDMQVLERYRRFQFVDKIPLNDSNSAYTDSYDIINLKAGYHFQILPKLEAHFATGVNNVTDEKYSSLILPNAVGVGNALPRYYYPGLPVNFYGMVSFNYSF
jgi:outer membrane receptor protein involved in Fe transport